MEWKAGDIAELRTSCERYVIEFINDRWVFCLSECKSPERTYLAPMDLFLRDVRRPAPRIGETWMGTASGKNVEIAATGPKCVAYLKDHMYQSSSMESFLEDFRRVP